MPSESISCIWCSKTTKNSFNQTKCWRNISTKRYQWIHQLIEERESDLEKEMLICGKCLTMLCKERKRRGTANGGASLSKSAKRNSNSDKKRIDNLDNLIDLEGFCGDGNDKAYCIWCLKYNTETVPLSAAERMSLLCDYKIYCSSNVRRCVNRCLEIPVQRMNEPARLTTKQTISIINDLIDEVHRVKLMPIFLENDSIASEEDYLAWTGWNLNQLKEMTSLISSHMYKSKHRSAFGAVCMYWIKLKTNLSFRQIGSLFKIQTTEENIRKRVEDGFHTVSTHLYNALVPSHLGLNHISRADALEHHTAYTKTFFGNNLSIIWDGTYIYTNKSEDHKLQQETYSGQKSRHLIKFMSIILPDGYVLDLIGPFKGKDNDAKISKAILDMNDNLSIICEPGDTQIVDRGFRDVAGVFQELGFAVKMPGFLQKGEKQLTAEQANDTRMTTKTRWVVESFHSQFKKWRFFSERISQDFIIHIDMLARTVAASLNKYRSRLYEGKSPEDYVLANKMLLLKSRSSHLEQLIINGDLSLRKHWKNILDIEPDFNFPHLTLDFLREYTCGIYQIKQSSSYAKAHLFYNDDQFEFQLYPSDDSILRCRLHSKHSRLTKYHLCIRFDNDDDDDPIKDHYCQCKSGARNLGCCSHVATVLWYIGYARHVFWTPPTRTDLFRKKIFDC